MTAPTPIAPAAVPSDGDSPGRRRTFGAVLACLVVTAAALNLLVGPVPQARFGHDVPVLLDGAWRVYQGQVPHVDFYTTLGPCFFLVIALGMVVVGPSTQAIVAATALVMVVLTAWAWGVARGRMSVPLAFLFCLAVALITSGAYLLGFPAKIITYAALYNRYCNAMLGIVLLETIVPLRHASPRARFWGGASSGALVALMFFTKFSFLASGGLLLTASVALVGLDRRRLSGLAVGAAVVGLPMMTYLRWDVAAVAADVRTTSVVYGSAAVEPEAVAAKLMPSARELLALVVLCGLFIAHPGANRWRSIVRFVAAAAVVGVVACVCLMSSYGSGDSPPLMFFALAAWELARRKLRDVGSAPSDRASPDRRRDELDDDSPWPLRVRIATLCVIAYLVVPLAAKQLRGAAYATSWKLGLDVRQTAAMRLDAAPLKDLLIVEADGYNNHDYVGKVNQGLQLLRQAAGPDDRVLVLDFSNPFNFGLRRPSPIGDSVSYHYQRNFNEAHHWPADELFRDVTIILVSRLFDPEATTPMIDIYGDYINEHFEGRSATDRWALFVRPKAETASGRR